jgi:hypothetical protein
LPHRLNRNARRHCEPNGRYLAKMVLKRVRGFTNNQGDPPALPGWHHLVGITALIGPSGCGTSTLLRVLNRRYELYPGHWPEGEVLLAVSVGAALGARLTLSLDSRERRRTCHGCAGAQASPATSALPRSRHASTHCAGTGVSSFMQLRLPSPSRGRTRRRVS